MRLKKISKLKLIKRTPVFDTEKDDHWYFNLKIKWKFLDLINTSSYLTLYISHLCRIYSQTFRNENLTNHCLLKRSFICRIQLTMYWIITCISSESAHKWRNFRFLQFQLYRRLAVIDFCLTYVISILDVYEWQVYLSVDTIFQSLWFLSGFPW